MVAIVHTFQGHVKNSITDTETNEAVDQLSLGSHTGQVASIWRGDIETSCQIKDGNSPHVHAHSTSPHKHGTQTIPVDQNSTLLDETAKLLI